MEETLEIAAGMRAARESNQLSLFGMEEETPEEPVPKRRGEFPVSELLTREKEVLGFYVSGNPLEEYSPMMSFFATQEVEHLSYLKDGDPVKLVGLVSDLKRRVSRKGEPWASFVIEDLTGKVEVVLFSGAYRQFGADIQPDKPVRLEGKLVLQEEEVKVIARLVSPLVSGDAEIHVRLPGNQDNQSRQQLLDILEENRGEVPVFIHMANGKIIKLDREYWAKASEGLKSRLEAVFGRGQVLVSN